jgi:hypothetical protein
VEREPQGVENWVSDNRQKKGNQITKDQIGVALSEVHATQKKANDRAWINACQNKYCLGQSLGPFRLSAHSQQACGDSESAQDEGEVIFKYLVHVIFLELLILHKSPLAGETAVAKGFVPRRPRTASIFQIELDGGELGR